MRKDIYVIPSTDVYGNATNTPYYTSSPNRSFSPSDGLFPSCADPQPRTNCIRPDTATGIVFAATNAAFEQVKKIRADKTYKPVVYTIGLGQYVDPQFMMDLANDPASSIKTNIDSNSPMGQYVAAPTAAQLSAAFQQIASQVLRISQ